MFFISILIIAISSFCTNDEDCSFNGFCAGNGACKCDAAWTGEKCEWINFAPAMRGSGLHTIEVDGFNTSSWGGSILYDNSTGMYHMWAAEMVNHCGITSWTTNSRIVHATSKSALGKYTRQEVVFDVFSTEPNAVRDPDTGEFVLFFTAHLPPSRTPSPHPPPCKCIDGSTTSCKTTQNEGPTYVSWAKSPEGPWSKPLELISVEKRESDTNLAAIILPGGALIGLWRIWKNGSWMKSVTATNYKDPSTYTFHQELLFPELHSRGTEDPGIYVDKRGIFHSLFHNMQPNGWDPKNVLGHAYSKNGLNWTYTGIAGNSSGKYTDGSEFFLTRRERPHPIFAQDGTTMIGISSGVTYNDSTTTGKDACYTFIQPVNVDS